MKISIEIDNIDKAQAIALESLLDIMVYLGNVGGSKWVCFYADGDGNFHPKITIDGKKVEHTKLIDPESLWIDNEYRIDFDSLYDPLRNKGEINV